MTYVFSDKTGTLTSNEMQLRQIAIEGTSYGHADFRCEGCHRLSALCSVAAPQHAGCWNLGIQAVGVSTS